MKIRLPWCLLPIATAFLACGNSSDDPALHELTARDQLEALTFVALSEHAGHSGIFGFWAQSRCLAADWTRDQDTRLTLVDPNPAITDLLARERPRLLPASRCGDYRGSEFWDPRTSRRAILLTIDTLALVTTDSAIVEGSYIHGPLDGGIVTCHFASADGHWTQTSCEQTGWY